MAPERQSERQPEQPQTNDQPPRTGVRAVQPASLKWQANGELSAHDVFHLVNRLRRVESGDHSNELWRLGHKYPNKESG